MKQNRYLTKSRYKLACECPTKLFYTGKQKTYPDRKLDDSFLQALAQGGYQVGELAKCHFPDGQCITTLDHARALQETREWMKKDRVILFEAAFAHESLFIRADVVVKSGRSIKLYEVKAKSWDSSGEGSFCNRDGTLKAGWRSYLHDVAFQKYVMAQNLKGHEIKAYLMMADKSVECSIERLNQQFKLLRDADGRRLVEVASDFDAEKLKPFPLCAVCVDRECDLIWSGRDSKVVHKQTFPDRLAFLAERYASDQKIPPVISAACKDCEFHAKPDQQVSGMKSGRLECLAEFTGWTGRRLNQPTVLDVWNFRSKDKLIERGCIDMRDMDEADIAPKDDNKPGLSASRRQWLQVQRHQDGDESLWLDVPSLSAEIRRWQFPLHFIDFETTMAALPFNAGRRPYEAIAFQFSHHVVHQNGKVEHRGQYLNATPGEFPNYGFLRALKKELEGDSGSVFRYSHHENTILRHIHDQLSSEGNAVKDRRELCRFIDSLTSVRGKGAIVHQGKRCMIDMCELVKRYYYDPATMGSNSIKQVLPSILNRSSFLQKKYGKPIYGGPGGIPSLNFQGMTWIQKDGHEVSDPYTLLPRLFDDVSDKDMALLSEDDELRDGGAAMTAYARMQFEEMSDYERKALSEALLKYCELDTLAMVMIYEGWKDLISTSGHA